MVPASNRCVLRVALVVALALSMVACAIVPKETVELSTTVGRDIATARESHRALAYTLFGRMKQDVNRFVDDIYAPYQIQFVLAQQKKRQAGGNENNLFSVMESAMQQPRDAQAQKDVLLVMQAVVEAVHEDVEKYRQLRMSPVLSQEQEVITAIERIYDQMERGNAVVTAHLASVVKVHQAQDEILAEADLAGLRERIGVTLSGASADLAAFVNGAQKVEGSIDEASAKVDEMTRKLDSLLKGD
jgi:hypothetical protein